MLKINIVDRNGVAFSFDEVFKVNQAIKEGLEASFLSIEHLGISASVDLRTGIMAYVLPNQLSDSILPTNLPQEYRLKGPFIPICYAKHKLLVGAGLPEDNVSYFIGHLVKISGSEGDKVIHNSIGIASDGEIIKDLGREVL